VEDLVSTIWQRLIDAWSKPNARSLPEDSDFRKEIPVSSGCYRYFPAAMVAIAAWSKVANDKHNPGEPLHWARGKSMDQDDCLARHDLDLADAQDDATELEEATCAAWRAMARLQLIAETLGAPLAPNARRPLDEVVAYVPTEKEGGPDLFDAATNQVLAHPAQKLAVQAFAAEAAEPKPERWIVEFDEGDGDWVRSADFPREYGTAASAWADAAGAGYPEWYRVRRLESK
jgi:hypothetical protein